MKKRTELFEFNENCTNTAYILGFIWADGWIQKYNDIATRINLEITEDDANEIECIFNNIGIHKFRLTRERPNRKSQVTFAYSDKNFIDFLINNDYIDRKIKGFKTILSNFNKESIKYFIKGLFDGDGCYYYNSKNSAKQICLSSCLEQNYTGISDLLDHLDIKYTIQKVVNTNSYSVLRMTSDKSCRKFINFLNESIEIGLIRKNNKIKELLTPLIRKRK